MKISPVTIMNTAKKNSTKIQLEPQKITQKLNDIEIKPDGFIRNHSDALGFSHPDSPFNPNNALYENNEDLKNLFLNR